MFSHGIQRINAVVLAKTYISLLRVPFTGLTKSYERYGMMIRENRNNPCRRYAIMMMMMMMILYLLNAFQELTDFNYAKL